MTRGIALGFLAYALFSTGDAFVKALGGRLTVFEIGFFVTLCSMVLLFFVKPAGERWRDMFRPHRPWLVLVRAVSGAIAGVLGVIAFTTLPLSQAYALIFLMPALVTILSAVLLREAIGPWRWGAVAVGFAGILLVVRPGFTTLMPGHLAALGVAFCGATTVVVLRVLGPSERRVSLIGCVTVVALAVNGLLMLSEFKGPSVVDLPLLAVAGACAGLGHLTLMAATRNAPAAMVGPTQYSQIVWAILIGAIVFQEMPDGLAVAGMALVMISGLVTVAREQLKTNWWRRTPLLRNRA